MSAIKATRSFSPRAFLILWAAGMLGVVSLLLIDIEALLAILPLPPETEIPMSIPALKAISLVQPAVILGIAVLVGCTLAHKVGLSSPIAEAAASGGNWIKAIRPQIPAGVVGGIAGGVSLVAIAAAVRPFLSPEMLDKLGKFGSVLPLPSRLLYGGITEELLLRWGLMTFIVWAAWRLFQKGRERPTATCYIWGI